MKFKKIILPFILLIAFAGYQYLNPLLPIITGYAAKNLASGVFVAGRTQESMEARDLNFSFIKYTKNTVNKKDKTVTSSFLWYTSTAITIPGFGCSLVNDATPQEMLSRPYTTIETLPANSDTIPWPMGDQTNNTLPQGINMQELNKAVSQAMSDTLPYKGTYGLMVVYKGQPVVEQYQNGFSNKNRFLSWSMGKSFTNAMVGLIVKEGRMNINEPLNYDAWKDDERKNITINNLMHMNSGLEWNEDYGNSSDVNNMLHKKGDMARFTIEKPYQYPSDSMWTYSSGATNIVCHAIRETINNDAEYYTYPRKALFNKIGMRSALWEVDASGTFVGSSYIYATLRDYARFGLLYLNNGNWMGKQILPTNWVDYTTSKAKGSDGQYGAFFWLNKSQHDYPDVPSDMYCCRGHDGQYIYIIPSKKLVVVRVGCSKKGTFLLNESLASIVNAFE
jgi:CubicO group peptidase (beta-lactamase class C family)